MSARSRVSSLGEEHAEELAELREEVKLLNLNVRSKSADEREAAAAKLASIAKHKNSNFLYRRVFHRDMNIKKLATHEDPYHVHKTLGILSLCSFFYRYGYCYLTTGTLGFSGDINDVFDWATMGVHLLLAFSSKIFRVPKKRLEDKPLVIYEEYRQHAMVFTLRCVSVYCCAVLGYKQWLDQFCGIAYIVAMHHLLADDVTRRHGSGVTAVRANVERAAPSPFYKKVGMLYSFYQFLAIASHILPTKGPNDVSVLCECAYNAIIAIASSAFMMTLYRKRIIRALAHMFIYSGCLVLSAFHICRHIGWHGTFLCTMAFMLRVNLPRAYSNKYAIWALFMLAYNFQHELFISEAHLAPIAAPIADTCSAAYGATVTPAMGIVSSIVNPAVDAIKAAIVQ